MFIQKIKDNYKIDEPIFIENILALFPEFTRAYVFRLIKQAETNGELIKFSRGVYYIPKDFPSFFYYENLGALFVTCRDMQKSPKIRHFRTIRKNSFTLFFAKFLHP